MVDYWCENCKTHPNVCMEQNSAWCMLCGCELAHETVYVRGYSNPQTYRRRQVYSRTKRIRAYIIKSLDSLPQSIVKAVLDHLDAILDIYGIIEFAWRSGVNSVRKYFFAKPVMFYVCCSLLGIETDSLPSLKDKTRESCQFQEIAKIIEEPMTLAQLQNLRY